MIWLAIEEDGQELVFDHEPVRYKNNLPQGIWVSSRRNLSPIGYEDFFTDCIELPKGSIKKLIGRELTWDDEPVEIKEEEEEWEQKE